jgi:endonuclease/exonuclease/phosphatase (EEP) superfamily protein YafD
MPVIFMPLLKRTLLRNGFLRLSQLSLLLLALIALGNLAGSEWGLLKKLVHFPAYWAPLALCLFTVLAVMRQWRWAMAGLVLSIGFAAQVATLWLPPQKDVTLAVHNASSPQATLTVLTFNVFKNNRRYAEVLAALQKEQADVVYLTEMSPEWFAALAPLEKDYPHRLTKKASATGC